MSPTPLYLRGCDALFFVALFLAALFFVAGFFDAVFLVALFLAALFFDAGFFDAGFFDAGFFDAGFFDVEGFFEADVFDARFLFGHPASICSYDSLDTVERPFGRPLPAFFRLLMLFTSEFFFFAAIMTMRASTRFARRSSDISPAVAKGLCAARRGAAQRGGSGPTHVESPLGAAR